MLKHFQGLPDRCANIAAYILLRAMPITSHIERQTLTVFLNIASNPGFIEHEIVIRQLSKKDEAATVGSHSLDSYCRNKVSLLSMKS